MTFHHRNVWDRRALRGFSLTELAVTIAVIAALIAILLPALGAARSAGQDASCRSKLQQIGVHVASSVASRGMLPPFIHDNPAFFRAVLDQPPIEPEKINPEALPTTEFARCPKDRSDFYRIGSSYRYWAGVSIQLTLQSISLDQDIRDAAKIVTRKFDAFSQPSKLVVVQEFGFEDQYHHTPLPPGTFAGYALNYDGHVGWDRGSPFEVSPPFE